MLVLCVSIDIIYRIPATTGTSSSPYQCNSTHSLLPRVQVNHESLLEKLSSNGSTRSKDNIRFPGRQQRIYFQKSVIRRLFALWSSFAIQGHSCFRTVSKQSLQQLTPFSR